MGVDERNFMSVNQMKWEDWLQKNKIMMIGFVLAAGLGLLAQFVQKSPLAIILPVAIPFGIAILAYYLSIQIDSVARYLPYLLVLLNFSISIGVMFFSEANLGTLGIVIILLIVSAIHGSLKIMGLGFGLSFVALFLNNKLFVDPDLVAASGTNLLVLHVLSGIVMLLLVRQNQKVALRIEELIGEAERRAEKEQAFSLQLDEGVTKITGNLEEIRANTNTAHESQTEMLSAVNEISSGSQRQADYIVEITENIDETELLMEEVREGMEAVIDQTNDAGFMAQEGSDKVMALEQSFMQFTAFFDELLSSFDLLTEKINETNSFTTAIKAITDQTNLLSLNASIEAARAGEHGQGFAIVANEIRNLSSMTAETLEKIEGNLSEVNMSNETMVRQLREGTNQVSTQSESIHESTATFKELFTMMTALKDELHTFVDKFKGASEGSRDIQNRTTDFSATVQESTATIEELHATLIEITAEQERILYYIHETHDEASTLGRLQVE